MAHKVPVIDRESCQQFYGEGSISNRQICFDFTNVRSEMLPFRVIAISFGKFWSWTPCTKSNGSKNAHFKFLLKILGSQS